MKDFKVGDCVELLEESLSSSLNAPVMDEWAKKNAGAKGEIKHLDSFLARVDWDDGLKQPPTYIRCGISRLRLCSNNEPQIGDIVEIIKNWRSRDALKVGALGKIVQHCKDYNVWAIKSDKEIGGPGASAGAKMIVPKGHGAWVKKHEIKITSLNNKKDKTIRKCTCEYYAVLNYGCKCGGV